MMNSVMLDFQYEAEKKMLDEFNCKNFTIDAPLIVMDPYNLNPLSAYICFRTQEETAITVRVCGRKKSTDMVQTFHKAKNHILPVYGLYLNSSTQVELSYYQGRSVVYKLETNDIDFPENVIIQFDADPIIFQNKLLVYSTPTTYFKYRLPFGIDSEGDIRWLLTKPFNWDFRKLSNGRIMVGSGDTVIKPYHMTGLFEIDWMGKIHVFYKINSLYHHDYFELDDNKLLVLTNKTDLKTTEDSLIVFNRSTGEITKRINYEELVDKNKVRRSGSWSKHDWCHNNSVWYDKNNNSLTVSLRHMDALLNIDYDSLKINWIFSDPKGWDPEYVDKYFLKPCGYNFEYTYGQHAISVDKKGSIICFDNHYMGKKHPDYVVPEQSYSRGVRFIINRKKREIKTEWSFGKDLGAAVYSPYISFIESFNDQHNLIHFGGITLENGVISQYHGPAANELDLEMESETFEIAYDRQLLHVRLRGNYYRARKINFLMQNYCFEHKKAIVVETCNKLQ